MEETLNLLRPCYAANRLVDLRIAGIAQNFASLGEGFDLSHGDELGDDIALGRGLDGAGFHAETGGVGCHLIEQCIAAASADDLKSVRQIREHVF